MKEALLKYTGEGFSRPLKSADTKSKSFGVKYITREVYDSSGMKYALAVCLPSFIDEYPSVYRITPNDGMFYRVQDVKDAIIALKTPVIDSKVNLTYNINIKPGEGGRLFTWRTL